MDLNNNNCPTRQVVSLSYVFSFTYLQASQKAKNKPSQKSVVKLSVSFTRCDFYDAFTAVLFSHLAILLVLSGVYHVRSFSSKLGLSASAFRGLELYKPDFLL